MVRYCAKTDHYYTPDGYQAIHVLLPYKQFPRNCRNFSGFLLLSIQLSRKSARPKYQGVTNCNSLDGPMMKLPYNNSRKVGGSSPTWRVIFRFLGGLSISIFFSFCFWITFYSITPFPVMRRAHRHLFDGG